MHSTARCHSLKLALRFPDPTLVTGRYANARQASSSVLGGVTECRRVVLRCVVNVGLVSSNAAFRNAVFALCGSRLPLQSCRVSCCLASSRVVSSRCVSCRLVVCRVVSSRFLSSSHHTFIRAFIHSCFDGRCKGALPASLLSSLRLSKKDQKKM